MLNKIKETFKLCRFDKPLLEIPFMFTSAFIVSEGFPEVSKLIYMFLAVTAGFMIGNVINGVADRKIDRLNPRTKDRPVAKGTLSVKYCMVLLVILFLILVISTYMIRPIYVLFLPIPAAIVLMYAYLKRKTCLCHICLGVVTAMAPVAAAGVFGSWIDYRGLFVGAIAFFGAIGFETIYSCQDVEYDLETGMHSMATTIGVKNTKTFALVSHILTAASMIAVGILYNVGIIMWIGIVLGCISLIIHHYIVQFRYEKISNTLNMYQVFSATIMIFSIIENIVYR